MAQGMKNCEKLALRLPLHERAALAEHLIASLDYDDPAQNEKLWVEEAQRRYERYKQGAIGSRPAKNVIKDARARLV